MVDHTKGTKGAEGTEPPTLPRNLKTLEQLLHDVREIIRKLDVIQRHQRYRIDTIRQLLRDPVGTLRDSDHQLREMVAVGNRLWAESLPPLALLGPYLDGAKHFKIVLRLRDSQKVLNIAAESGASSPSEYANALETFTEVLQCYLEFLFDFRCQILAQLATQADTRTDRRKKIVATLPRNPKAMELYRRLQDYDPEETSKIAVAIDLSDGDVKKAEALMKAVCRYETRLKEAES